MRILLLSLTLTAACSPTLPARFPESSAASSEAEAAPVTPVGRALREEPPLPGEPQTGWEGLEDGESTPTHGGHVHAH